MKENKRVAVFIDAENISAKFADKLIAETSNYGDVIVRRVFADWSSPNVKEWQDVVQRHSLMAEQQFSPVKGKNSGDISLIINAMIVLFEKDIDVFCLASSDSDFTRLVQELREREKTVIGFGLKQTARAFVNAFSEFIYLDSDVKQKEIASENITGKSGKQTEKPSSFLENDRLDALKDIIDKLIEDDGRALYARIALEMKNKFSDFVPKNYDCKSLKELIEKNITKIGCYTIKTDKDGTTMYLVTDETCKVQRLKELAQEIKGDSFMFSDSFDKLALKESDRASAEKPQSAPHKKQTTVKPKQKKAIGSLFNKQGRAHQQGKKEETNKRATAPVKRQLKTVKKSDK